MTRIFHCDDCEEDWQRLSFDTLDDTLCPRCGMDAKEGPYAPKLREALTAALARVAALETERDNLPDVTERALEEANYHRSANEFLTANLNRATEQRDAALARVAALEEALKSVVECGPLFDCDGDDGCIACVARSVLDPGAPLSTGPDDLCE